MVLYSCVLIVFSLRRESVKLILVEEPPPRGGSVTELHRLTPSGILHIVSFETSCEAYMGIESHFNLWNYFFLIWLQPDSDAEVAVWGCTAPFGYR
jgi:hypothetical protein